MAENRQGTIVGAPQYKARADLEATPLAGASDAGENFFGRVRATFARLAGEVGRLADRAAAREGALEGTLAGLDPEFRPRRDGTIRGEAFDAAGIDIAKSRMTTRIYQRAAEIADANPENPAAIVGGIDQAIGEWGQSFPELRAHAVSIGERLKVSYAREATRTLDARLKRERQETTADDITERTRSLGRATAAAGLDDTADKVIAGELDELRQTVSEAVKRGDMTAAAGARTVKQAERTAAEGRILGAFDRLPGAAARQAYLDGIDDAYAKGEGAWSMLEASDVLGLKAKMSAALRTEGVEARREATAAGNELNALVKSIEDGYAPTDDQLASLRARAAQANDPKVSERLAAVEGFMSLAADARRMTPAELDGAISRMEATIRDKGASPDVLRIRAGAQRLLTTMRAEIGRDPLGWADRTGAMPVPAIDFAAPGADTAMRDRVARADVISERYGSRPTYLRPEEKTVLTRALNAGGETMMATIDGLAAGFGDRAPRVFAELSPEAPMLAHVAGLAASGGSRRLAVDVADAVALRSDPNTKERPKSPAEIRAAGDAAFSLASDVYGEAFGANGGARLAAESTAKVAFEARVVRGGLDPKLKEKDSQVAFRQTLQEAAGATFAGGVQYGGVGEHDPDGYWAGRYKVVVPPRVRADRFTEVVDAITDADLAPAGDRADRAAATPAAGLTAAQLHAAHLVAVSPGRYQVAIGDPAGDDPQWVTALDGRRWILDMNAMEPSLRKRVPGAFLGGGR